MFSEIQYNGRSSEAVENLQQETDPYISIESLKCGGSAPASAKERESDYSFVEVPERQKKPEFEVCFFLSVSTVLCLLFISPFKNML